MLNSQRRSFSWTLAHVLFFSGTALVVKLSSAHLAVATMIFARSLLGIVVLLATSPAAVKSSFTSGSLGLLLTRGVLGFLGVYGTFVSLTLLPIPIAMMIVGTTPLLVMLFGALFLGESIKKEIVLYAVLVAVSIYFVARTPADAAAPSLSAVAVLIAAGSSIATALAFITVRAVVKKTGTVSVVFWFSACGLLGATLVGGLPTELLVKPSITHLYVALICLLGVASDLTKTNAYKYSAAWFVSLVSVLTIAVSGLLSWAVLGETVAPVQIAGIAALMGFLALAILRGRPPTPARPSPAASISRLSPANGG